MSIDNLELKKCNKCNLFKKPNEFSKDRRLKSGLRAICKECISKERKSKYENDPQYRMEKRIYAKEYWKKNKEKLNNNHNIWVRKNWERIKTEGRIYRFLYGDYKSKGGYLVGQNICLYCWEINPFLLENHHIFNKDDSDYFITLCSKCHSLITRYPKMLSEWY